MTLIHDMSVTMPVYGSYAVTIDLRPISIDEPPGRQQSCHGDVTVIMTMTNQK